MELCSVREVSMVKALSVVLQHPAVAADQQNICRLLQVSKAWRSIVQQSGAGITDVTFIRSLSASANEQTSLAADIIAEVGGLAHWLSVYAGIVGSFHLDLQGFNISIFTTIKNLEQHAHQMLALGMRAAAAAADRPPTTAANSSTASAAGAVIAVPLQLRSFTCISPVVSPHIVAALPAATLSHLEITVPSNILVHEALGNLSNLRSLDLCSNGGGLSDNYLSSINKLTKLTMLSLVTLESDNGLTLLPRQLIRLKLHIDLEDDSAAALGDLDLSCFSQLVELSTHLTDPITSFIFPQQLRILNVTFHTRFLSTVDITSLQQLQQLTISDSSDSPADLLSLKQLQQLEKLTLQYESSTVAVVAASVWSQLQQLVALRLEFSCNAIQINLLLDAVCVLSTLTKLTLECYWMENEDQLAPAQAVHESIEHMSRVCQSLKQLTNLRQLDLDLVHWADQQEGDLVHLSSLTALTNLWLRSNQLKTSCAAIAVLLELTQLQDLTLCFDYDISVLPVIGKLQGLTILRLPELPKDIQSQGLRFLTRLRNLKELYGFEECSKAELKQFWADLRAVV